MPLIQTSLMLIIFPVLAAISSRGPRGVAVGWYMITSLLTIVSTAIASALFNDDQGLLACCVTGCVCTGLAFQSSVDGAESGR